MPPPTAPKNAPREAASSATLLNIPPHHVALSRVEGRRGGLGHNGRHPVSSPGTGLTRLPASPFQRAVPITPVDRAGTLVDFSPARAAFPEIQAGRHPHHHFRGLLRLHSRYGPLDCSTAQDGLCHEASALPVTRQSRSSATRPIANHLAGTFLHWCYAPSGRTE
jgi:hypothetical protein